MKLIEALILQGREVFELSVPVMDSLSATEASQGILLVFRKR